MISVLIPLYNYNVYPLVKEIHKQISKQGIDFEILVYDDASTKLFEVNNLIKELENVKYKKLNKNVGRTKIRHILGEEAKYNNLLFLDADVFPKDRFFITKFIKEIEKFPDFEVYYGGTSVPDNIINSKSVLRHKFGVERESQDLNNRRIKPYLSIISQAFLIKKDVFLNISENIKDLRMYGLDIYFSFLLKKNSVRVHHFNNQIIHLGIEENEQFIEKTNKAIQTLNYLIKKGLINSNYSKLGRTTYKIKRLHLCFLFSFFYRFISPLLLFNLKSNKPILFLFDIYKLFYFCKII